MKFDWLDSIRLNAQLSSTFLCSFERNALICRVCLIFLLCACSHTNRRGASSAPRSGKPGTRRNRKPPAMTASLSSRWVEKQCGIVDWETSWAVVPLLLSSMQFHLELKQWNDEIWGRRLTCSSIPVIYRVFGVVCGSVHTRSNHFLICW